MKNSQENKLSMYETVGELLDANGTLVSTVPALVTAKSALVNKTLEIRAMNMVQKKSTKGKTLDKTARKNLLADTSYGVAAAVQAYAAETENNDLYNLVNFTRSALRETEDEELAQVCQLIHDQANGVVTSLGDYGVAVTDLVLLQGLITAWGTQSQAPRMAISERKAATHTLPSLFKAADAILKTRMDKLMENFRANERTFYDTYHVARKIVDAGHGPKKVAKLGGVVLDNPMGMPIKGATVQIGDVVVTTGADGRFVAEKVPFGERTVVVKALGFIELTETGTVDGDRDDLVFRLDPMVPPPPMP
ncbi:MAG: carboxypeptidase-like regulatory domain-containing protein [Flavobacteriales bacterium]|nr:carboxypeptidase-like regulatory domain-containing protein [Flavobacteriales bacterium]